MTSESTGLIAQTLEAQVRTQVRRHGVVPWLDQRGEYTGFVDALAARDDLGFTVVAFRGSHLDLMLAIEALGAGVDPPRVLLHLPGFNEERVKASPAYPLYVAGARFRKALDTLVTEAATGHAPVDQLTAFLQGDDVTFEGAEAWLAGVMARNLDVGGVAARLDGMRLTAVIDDLIDRGAVSGYLPHDADAVWRWLTVQTGCPADWRPRVDATTRADVLFGVVSWALCVEFADDLTRPPKMAQLRAAADLPDGLITACRELAAHLRARHRGVYERVADETVLHIEVERRAAKADDLGSVDTFRFEEAVMAHAALADLASRRWDVAAERAGLRLQDGGAFWLTGRPERAAVWQLIAAAATLGQRIDAAGTALKAAHLSTAVQRYVERGAAVDTAHRRLESVRDRLLFPTLPDFERLRRRLDAMRVHWRTWADAWAEQFSALCDKEGFLPESGLQQRTLFEDVVLPAVQAGPTALFLIDALRYEMAEALLPALQRGGEAGARVKLDARLAELPTITAVGMNALAPVARHGALRPTLKKGKPQGFHTGEFTVNSPANRKRAMAARAGGKTCPWWTLEDVLEKSPSALRGAVTQSRLVVVSSLEIDGPAEKGAGLNVFEPVLQRLRGAWHRLRDAGVRRFVITSDHGFLLVDPEARALAQKHGRAGDSTRRYAYNTQPINQDGEARVPLRDLRYEGAEGHFIFPRTTALFEVGAHDMRFVHGGNSLQERVIPVLTVTHAAPPGAPTMTYRVDATAAPGMGGMHALSATLQAEQRGMFGANTADLTLRVQDADAQQGHNAVQIELCHVRGATLDGGTIQATLNQQFDVFFRLTGAEDGRVQVTVENAGSPIEITPGVIAERFAVAARLDESQGRERDPEVLAEPHPEPGDDTLIEPAPAPAPVDAGSIDAGAIDTDWIDAVPALFRPVFAHLAQHGSVTEREATRLLGTPRRFRKFNSQFEELSRLAPFVTRVDIAGGLKTYIRLKRTSR